MENQECVIKGTIEGMIKILQNDFDMSYDEAKFFVYVMIDRHDGEAVNRANKEEIDAWYLETDSDKYEGRILNTHFVINFTTIKMNLFHTAYIFFVNYFFDKGIDLVLIGADLVYIVATAIKRVADTDYCVYARIIELCIESRDRFFDINDIVTANQYGKCDYQSENWKCTYYGKNDDCTCNKKKIELALIKLSEQKIIQKIGNYWRLVY